MTSRDFPEDLFSPPTARVTDPETSHEAAADAAPNAHTDRANVLVMHYRHRHSGLTDYELAAKMERQQNSVGKRRGELRDAGLIAQDELKRPAPSGSSAFVWKITGAGMAMARKLLEGK